MLNIKQVDVFNELKAGDIFVHGCNSKGVMGSGIAKNVKDKWPKAYRIYKQAVLLGTLKVGEWNAYFDSHKNICVVNLVTQENFGRNPHEVYVDYVSLHKGLSSILDECTGDCKRVVFPYIGGGLANGDRKILLDIYHEVFDNAEIEGVLVID